MARVRSVYAGYDTQAGEQRKRDLHNSGNTAILRQRRALLRTALWRTWPQGVEHVRFLDVGCGSGELLDWLRSLGAKDGNLHGIDLLQDRINAARGLLRGVDLRLADARHLPFPDGAFDLVICSTLFSSILEPDVAEQAAAEVLRVLAPRGAVLWYDVRMPNPRNANTIEMTRSRIHNLFPDLRDEIRSATLIPPLARRLGPLTWAFYGPLAAIPFLRSHYLGLLRRA